MLVLTRHLLCVQQGSGEVENTRKISSSYKGDEIMENISEIKLQWMVQFSAVIARCQYPLVREQVPVSSGEGGQVGLSLRLEKSVDGIVAELLASSFSGSISN